MNRYNARSGRSYKVSESSPATKTPTVQREVRQPRNNCAHTPAKKKDMGDMWVLAVFFLLYMESRDADFLIILAVLALSMFDMGGVLKGFGINL